MAEYVNYLIGKPLPLHTKHTRHEVTKLQTNCQLTFALTETFIFIITFHFTKFILLSARKETHISTLSTLIPQAVVASSRIP